MKLSFVKGKLVGAVFYLGSSPKGKQGPLGRGDY